MWNPAAEAAAAAAATIERLGVVSHGKGGGSAGADRVRNATSGMGNGREAVYGEPSFNAFMPY